MAELRYTYQTEDEIPEEHRALFAAQEDGTFRLQATGAVAKQRLDDMRASNITLQRRVEQLEGSSIDPDELAELRKIAEDAKQNKEKSEHQKLLEENKLDELREQIRKEATEPLIKARDEALAARDTNIKNLQAQLRAITISSKLQSAATEAELEPWAIGDAVTLGERVFDLDAEGNVVAYEYDPATNTRRQRYNSDGEPLTIEGWLKEEVSKRPGWIPGSAGGGAQHGNGRGAQGGSRATQKRSEMSPKEASNYISEHGRGAYLELPA